MLLLKKQNKDGSKQVKFNAMDKYSSLQEYIFFLVLYCIIYIYFSIYLDIYVIYNCNTKYFTRIYGQLCTYTYISCFYKYVYNCQLGHKACAKHNNDENTNQTIFLSFMWLICVPNYLFFPYMLY